MNIAESIKRARLTEKDFENVRALGKAVEAELPAIIKMLLKWILKESAYPDFFRTEEFQTRIKESQLQLWSLFFSGNIDENYIQMNRIIGESHVQMNLPISMYMASQSVTSGLFKDAFIRLKIDQYELLHSFNKIMLFDISLVIDSYNQLISKQLQEQQEALMEMSTPVAQLWEGILLLPLVGVIDSKRAQEAMSTMLNKITETQAKVFILDISGVGVVDTAVANHLIKMTKAAKLMGCLCTISGLSPAVAQTIVELGVQIDEVNTTATMKDALKNAFNLVGTKITRL